MHDYMFDQETCDWVHWMKTVPTQELPPSLAFNEIIVQTIDTVRYSYLMRLLMTHGHHTLFTGLQQPVLCSSVRKVPKVVWSCRFCAVRQCMPVLLVIMLLLTIRLSRMTVHGFCANILLGELASSFAAKCSCLCSFWLANAMTSRLACHLVLQVQLVLARQCT